MVNEDWILLGEAFNRVMAKYKLPKSQDQKGRALILANLSKSPTIARTLNRHVENWRQHEPTETLEDYPLPASFWQQDFGAGTSGVRGWTKEREERTDCWWNWGSSDFGLSRSFTGRDFSKSWEVLNASAVRVHWPSLLANINQSRGQQVAESLTDAKGSGGRPPGYDWLQGFAYLVAVALEGDLDESPTASEVAHHLAEWALLAYGREPSMSVRMGYAKRVIAEINQLKLRREG